MTFEPTRLLVTGGAGFIGSAAVDLFLDRVGKSCKVVVLDALTYAGHRINLDRVASDPRLLFIHGDICDAMLVRELFAMHCFDSVLHLAAESHVDRSIEFAGAFIRTNVTGTFTLLDAARHAWESRTDVRFIHVSTDEVFGTLGESGLFTETSQYAPNSPYAASKAASNLLVRAYFKTYGLPAIITNCCNNYGPRQLPEKLFPLMITRAAAGEQLPVYGEGKQIREWIHVEDHAEGLWHALTQGSPGQSYLFGTGDELTNLDIVNLIADAVDAHLGRKPGTSRKLIRFVTDRKGHDFRYAVDSTKARRELGWMFRKELRQHVRETVGWYLENATWTRTVSTAEHERFQGALMRSTRE